MMMLSSLAVVLGVGCAQQAARNTPAECAAHADKMVRALDQSRLLHWQQTLDLGNAVQVNYSVKSRPDSVSLTYYGPATTRWYWYSSRLYRYDREGAPDGKMVLSTKAQAESVAHQLIAGLRLPFPVTLDSLSISKPERVASGRWKPGYVVGVARPYRDGLPLFSAHGVKFRVDVRDGLLLSASVRSDLPTQYVGRQRFGRSQALASGGLGSVATLGYRVGRDNVGRLCWRVKMASGSIKYLDASTGRVFEEQ